MRTSAGTFATQANPAVRLLCWTRTTALWEILTILLATLHSLEQVGMSIFKQACCNSNQITESIVITYCQVELCPSDIQLANYDAANIGWLFDILGSDLMYAKAQVWERRNRFSTHYLV